jgi:hypothetical protein
MDGRTVPLGLMIIAGDSIDVMMSSCLISCLCMPFISFAVVVRCIRCLGQALYGLQLCRGRYTDLLLLAYPMAWSATGHRYSIMGSVKNHPVSCQRLPAVRIMGRPTEATKQKEIERDVHIILEDPPPKHTYKHLYVCALANCADCLSISINSIIQGDISHGCAGGELHETQEPHFSHYL